MYHEISKKREELLALKPFPFSMEKKINDLNKVDWLCNEIFLNGIVEGNEIELSKADIACMAQGLLVDAASMREYAFTERFLKCWSLIRDWLELNNQLDKRMLLKFYEVLTEKAPSFRQSNSMVSVFSHVPADKSQLEKEVDDLFRQIHNGEGNVIAKAAQLHCRILEIYPFEEYNGAVARFAMNYCLMEQELPPVALGYSPKEYVETIRKCFHERDGKIFLYGLERAVYNKLEVILQTIAQDEAGAQACGKA